MVANLAELSGYLRDSNRYFGDRDRLRTGLHEGVARIGELGKRAKRLITIRRDIELSLHGLSTAMSHRCTLSGEARTELATHDRADADDEKKEAVPHLQGLDFWELQMLPFDKAENDARMLDNELKQGSLAGPDGGMNEAAFKKLGGRLAALMRRVDKLEQLIKQASLFLEPANLLLAMEAAGVRDALKDARFEGTDLVWVRNGEPRRVCVTL